MSQASADDAAINKDYLDPGTGDGSKAVTQFNGRKFDSGPLRYLGFPFQGAFC